MKKQLEFGDYVYIEQKRYGIENEKYLYKVIKTGAQSNTYVKVPVQTPATAEIQSDIEEIVYCVCCGVQETEILPFRVKDVVLKPESKKDIIINKIKSMNEKEIQRLFKDFCSHTMVKKKGEGAYCTDCETGLGWYCNQSPDNLCHYYSFEKDGKNHVELSNGHNHELDSSYDNEYETEDDCIFCHEPEERK